MRTAPFRDAHRHMGCTKAHAYRVRRTDPDFIRLVPVFYPANIPTIDLDDLDAYKAFKREQAIAENKLTGPRSGRPRKVRIDPQRNDVEQADTADRETKPNKSGGWR
jgi:hypothetical protein